MSGTGPARRSAAPWLFGLAAVLAVLSPLLFLAVWIADGTLDGIVPAFLVAVADFLAAVVVTVLATLLAARRGVAHVRTVVTGHPQGRAGRMAEHHAARWSLARDRFASLQHEYAAFESDPRAVAARPALVDVGVPATARFVEAYGDAQFLLSDSEPLGPRREEFVAAVDRAVAAWHEAQRTADTLAQGGNDAGRGPETRAVGPGQHTPAGHGSGPSPEYAEVADAVRRAAARGMKDLRARIQG